MKNCLMANHLFLVFQQNNICPTVTSSFCWACSFLLETRSCQTKKLPWGQSRYALLPKFHGCRARLWRSYLTKDLREKSRDYGNWCAQPRNSFELGPLEQFFTVYMKRNRTKNSRQKTSCSWGACETASFSSFNSFNRKGYVETVRFNRFPCWN